MSVDKRKVFNYLCWLNRPFTAGDIRERFELSKSRSSFYLTKLRRLGAIRMVKTMRGPKSFWEVADRNAKVEDMRGTAATSLANLELSSKRRRGNRNGVNWDNHEQRGDSWPERTTLESVWTLPSVSLVSRRNSCDAAAAGGQNTPVQIVEAA